MNLNAIIYGGMTEEKLSISQDIINNLLCRDTDNLTIFSDSSHFENIKHKELSTGFYSSQEGLDFLINEYIKEMKIDKNPFKLLVVYSSGNIESDALYRCYSALSKTCRFNVLYICDKMPEQKLIAKASIVVDLDKLEEYEEKLSEKEKSMMA